MIGGNQLALGLTHPPALSRDDFVIGDCNRDALAAVDAWPDWPNGCLLLTGPEGSGKSHLVQIWSERCSAVQMPATALNDDRDPLADADSLAVEDIDRAAGNERALFHLLNRARERDATVLLTARDPAYPASVTLPDLASRLRALRPASLAPPDDPFLRRVLVKLLADRRLTASPALLEYLLARMERTFAAAASLVARLDEAALATGRPLSRHLAGQVLAEPDGARAGAGAAEAK